LCCGAASYAPHAPRRPAPPRASPPPFHADPDGPSFERTLDSELHRISSLYFDREEALAASLAALAAAPPPRAAPAVAALRADLLHLRKYVVLNYIAVVKAVKKRNRHLRAACAAAPPRPLRAAAILTSQPFYTSQRLAAMTTRAELLALESGPAPRVEDVVEAYSCAICLDLLRSPVVLTCAHRFCWGCLVAHCSAGAQAAATAAADADEPAKAGGGDGAKAAGAAPGSPASVLRPATWDSSDDDEGATVATFGCPCCRKDQLLDLDRLQVDPHLAAFLQGLQRTSGGGGGATTTTTTTTTSTPASQRAPEALHLVLQPPAKAAVEPPAPEAPLLPPQRPEHAGRLCVCLDLDGTLVTTFTPKRAPSLPPSAVSYVVGRGGRLNPGGVCVVERPGLGPFLRRLSAFAEVVVFTAGLEDYASPIFDAIEARYGAFAHRLYRPACVPAEAYPCVKDLARLGRAGGRCVLVDDTPLAFLHQPDNGVPVLQFRGDVDDRLLPEAVAPLLEALAGEADVRTALARRFNMRRWFAAQGLAAAEAAAPRPAASAAPRAAAPARLFPASPAAGVLLVCDFDKTLTDWDAGERLCDELAPELTSLLSQVESPANSVPTTNVVLAEMQRRGVSRDAIVRALRGMGGELPDGTLRMLRWAHGVGVDVRVLSDANSLFIGHVLTAAGAHTYVRDIVTNAAAFQRVAPAADAEDAAGDDAGVAAAWFARPAAAAGKAAPQHRMIVAPRHDGAALGHHGCPLCPANLCKGRELDAMRAAPGAAHRRIVYAGDGANDLCPALCLGPDDVVLARAGHPLAALLAERAGGGGGRRAAAQVRVWRDHDELCRLAQEAAAA
jgi:Dullard-like phosphatase family protein